MADVFVSYSQKDRPIAEAMADKLISNGFSVWWDSQLVGGEFFRTAIEEQLAAAKVVIVLWSANAVESRYVVDEADVAAATSKLVSVLLEGFPASKLPLGFRALQSVSIADEKGLERALQRRGLTISRPPPPVGVQPVATETVAVLDEDARENEAWQFVLARRDEKLVADFRKRFPNSKHTAAAVVRERHLKQLGAKATIQFILYATTAMILFFTPIWDWFGDWVIGYIPYSVAIFKVPGIIFIVSAWPGVIYEFVLFNSFAAAEAKLREQEKIHTK